MAPWEVAGLRHDDGVSICDTVSLALGSARVLSCHQARTVAAQARKAQAGLAPRPTLVQPDTAHVRS
jgi:hypothetical protein